MTQFNAEELAQKYVNMAYEQYNQERWHSDSENHAVKALDSLSFIVEHLAENIEKDFNQAYLKGAEDAKADAYTAGYNKAVEDSLNLLRDSTSAADFSESIRKLSKDNGHKVELEQSSTASISKLKKG